ncbi:BQ2448_7357 [Microbotryum intermedium]|uniref:BQ2448_7357 protein n=1 Tax=Microbotryum intermedium TaxID=269621 RepID=A0A238FMQ2_9BASI|nr:BQ2448_7357 [Microbotryum intermedium]
MGQTSHDQDALISESHRAISSSPETTSNVRESSPVAVKRITRPPNAFILFRADQVKLIKETEPEFRSKPQSELSKVRSTYDEKAEGLKRELLEKYGPGALARGPRKPRKSDTAPIEPAFDGRTNSSSGATKTPRTTSHSSAPSPGHTLGNGGFQYSLPPASGGGAPSSHQCAVMAPWHPSFIPNAARTKLKPRPLSPSDSPTHTSGMAHADMYFPVHHPAQSMSAEHHADYSSSGSSSRIPQRGEAIRFASGGGMPPSTMMGSMPRPGGLPIPEPTAHHRGRPNASVAHHPYGPSTYYSARAPDSYWSTEGSVSSRSRSWNQLPRSVRVSHASEPTEASHLTTRSRSWDERHGLHAETDDRSYQPQHQPHHHHHENHHSGTHETYFTAQHGTCLYPLPPTSNDVGGAGGDGASSSTAAEIDEVYAYASREMFQPESTTDDHREASWDQLVQWDVDGSAPPSHAH